MKYDVTKQEINFFQSKLKDQREWTERCLAESSTATRAAALDSQAGGAWVLDRLERKAWRPPRRCSMPCATTRPMPRRK